MSSNPPFDPRLNCAAEICCGQPDANLALDKLLGELGCPESHRASMVKKLREKDLVILPGVLARNIRGIAFGTASSSSDSPISNGGREEEKTLL